MEALERYYREYLWQYSSDSNWTNYDLDMQLTKDTVEQILDKGYMDTEDVRFVRSLLPDIEDISIQNDLEEYLCSLIIS